MNKVLLTLSGLALCALTAAAQTTVTLTVNAEKKQTITGFGAAALENLMRPVQDPELIRLAYEPESPIGLNIMRIEMSSCEKGDITAADIGWDTPYDWHGYLPAVKEAKKHGAIVFATPWSPPASMKTNGETSGGQGDDHGNVHGKLKYPEKLFPWMNNFLAYMHAHGADIDIVSTQNEPDWWVGYSGCEYSPEELRDQVKNYGYQLKKDRYGVKLMYGEPLGFSPRYYPMAMEDPDVASQIDVLAGHVYGSYDCKKNIASLSAIAQGKEIWMTEHGMDAGSPNSGIRELPSWHQELEFAEDVHECLINGATAYVYWYMVKEMGFIGDGTDFDSRPTVADNWRGNILKRGYIMGQFARNLRGATMLKSKTNLQESSSTPGVVQSFETSAAIKGDSIIVNVIDTLGKDFILAVTLPYKADGVTMTRSTETETCTVTTPEMEHGRKFNVLIPARSFTTLVFHLNDESLAIETPRIPLAQRDAPLYNLNGQRVKRADHGVFIRGGKKVIIN